MKPLDKEKCGGGKVTEWPIAMFETYASKASGSVAREYPTSELAIRQSIRARRSAACHESASASMLSDRKFSLEDQSIAGYAYHNTD